MQEERRKEGREQVRLGVEGGRASKREQGRKRERGYAKRCPPVFKTDRLISLSSRSLLLMGGEVPLSSLYSVISSLLLPFSCYNS